MEPQTENNGQVHLNTAFGRWLYSVAQIKELKTFLEIGTWKGNGTTLCTVSGILKRLEENPGEVHFYSFEANRTFHIEALNRYALKPYPFLHLVYGKVHTDGLMTKEEIESHPYFAHVKTHYDLWYGQDCIDYKECPFINLDYLPESIDVLILDGGEFSGYGDWEALKKKNPKIVCLDDTCVMKNERVYKELKEDKTWQLLAGDEADRHGWAVFGKLF